MDNETVHIVANLDMDKNVTLYLNKFSLEGLILDLQRILDYDRAGGDVHLDSYTGLEGNINSLIIARVD